MSIRTRSDIVILILAFTVWCCIILTRQGEFLDVVVLILVRQVLKLDQADLFPDSRVERKRSV